MLKLNENYRFSEVDERGLATIRQVVKTGTEYISPLFFMCETKYEFSSRCWYRDSVGDKCQIFEFRRILDAQDWELEKIYTISQGQDNI